MLADQGPVSIRLSFSRHQNPIFGNFFCFSSKIRNRNRNQKKVKKD